MRYTDLLNLFMQLENHSEYTVERIRKWIFSQHLQRSECVPLPLTTKRWVTRLYTAINPPDITPAPESPQGIS